MLFFVHSSQMKLCVNVWAGLISNKLISPCVFPKRLNSADYCEFLTGVLPGLLAEKLTPEEIGRIIY